MSVPAVLAKAAEIAARYGPSIVDAWNLIHQGLRAEVPELLGPELPRTDDAYEEAVKAKQAELRARREMFDEKARADAEARALAEEETDDGEKT